MSVLGVNCRHILLYNLGLQQLYGGQPLAAFDSLLEVVQVFHGNPRLWLRLAEACIASHAKVCHILTSYFYGECLGTTRAGTSNEEQKQYSTGCVRE